MPEHSNSPTPIKIGLGTAQFGMDYGATNTAGQVPPDEIERILMRALELSPNIVLDTAPAYGNSEEVLGRALSNFEGAKFKIITKTAPQDIQAGFENSLKALGQNNLYAWLDHNASHLLSDQGDETYKVMHAQKSSGAVQKIGATVYSRADIETLLSRYELDILQVPVNVFDQRLIDDDYLNELKKEGIEIHARSVFLQGVLLSPIEQLSSFFHDFKDQFQALDTFCEEHDITRAQMCIQFVQNLKAIDCVVLGVLSQTQLEEHIGNAEASRVYDFSMLASKNETLINPSLWPQNK